MGRRAERRYGTRDRYGGLRSDYLYPAWESTKSAYRRLSPTIYNAATPVLRGIRRAVNLSPIIYNAASLRYSSPLMDRAYGYTQSAADALSAYDALAGPRVTGSLAGASIHGAQGLYHGYRALSHLYSADPLNAALHTAYALSHGQRAAREGFARLRNKYLSYAAAAAAKAPAAPARYRAYRPSTVAMYRPSVLAARRRR